MSRRRILITGTSGRLGSALAHVLYEHHDIVQLDLREPPDPAQHNLGPVFTGSITDPVIIAQAAEGVDTVIHCAAIPSNRKPYHELFEINVIGTFNVLEEAGRRTLALRQGSETLYEAGDQPPAWSYEGNTVQTRLNRLVAKGAVSRGKNRPARYHTALGSLREALACLEVAAALGYLPEVDPELTRRFDHVLGTLVRLVGGHS